MDHREPDEGSNGCGMACRIPRRAAIAADPGERPFDDPALRQHLKAGDIGSLHDLQLPCTCTVGHERHLLTRISALGAVGRVHT